MEIKSLTLKDKLVDDKGEEFLDLSVSSIRAGSDPLIQGIYVVDEETEMRVDLISYKFYGTFENIDVILKANNIFNPFSIQQGDVLIIPRIDSDNEIYASPQEGKKRDLRAQFTDIKRLSQKDKNRIERIKEKAKGKAGAVSNPLPPNILPTDKPAKIFKDGVIRLGTNLNDGK